MSELKIINTKQYNSELDEVCKNETDIFIKTKLTRRVTFGEYQFEPKNGFETDNAYYSDPINLDECEVYYLHQPTLNDKQKIVLEWLKDYTLSEAVTPIDTVAIFWKERNWMGQPQEWRMTGKQQAQVLQAFSQWVLEQEEE